MLGGRGTAVVSGLNRCVAEHERICSRRRLLGAFGGAAIGLVLPAVRPQAAGATWGATVIAPELNLRAEPGTWAEVSGVVWGGEWVELLDGPTGEGWWWVAAGDRAGWADGAFLAVDGVAFGGEAGSGWDVGGDRWVDVNRSSGMVTLFAGDAPVNGFWAAMGADGSADGFFATAVGSWSVYEKTEGLAWTDFGGGFITHWAGFDPNRLNGFHSFLLDENGWPIAGGDGPTGGCVALDPWAAAELYWFVSVGTRVEVHW
jgi:hypothetical protein